MLLRLNNGEDITIENRTTGNHLVILCREDKLMCRNFNTSQIQEDKRD